MDITDSPIQLQNMYNRKSNTYAEHKIFPYVTTEDIRMDLMDKVIRSCCPGYITDAIYRVENLDRYDDRLQVTTNLIEAYEFLMDFVAKHTSDKFCLINNVNTSIRGIISREVIANILVHRDYSSAFPAKVIIEKDWLNGLIELT